MTASVQRFRSIRTYKESWMQLHRETHVQRPEFGTHHHPYLHELIGKLAAELTADERPTLLDYGCGKGAFLSEMTRSGLFRFARGYDPAVAAFKSRPSQVYDLVVCLDVLDQVEDEFIEPLIEDVAQFTGEFAVFSVISVQTPQLSHLKTRSAAAWEEVIGRHVSIDQMIVREATPDELRAGACPERTIFVVSPRSREGRPHRVRTAADPTAANLGTYSPERLRGQQQAHAVADAYGRHGHLYLHDTMRRIATNLRQAKQADGLSWLDYGCGKGGFIEQIGPLGLFTTIRGFDPAVTTFANRPEGRFDLVTCLDVLDTVEPQFLANFLNDVAAFTEGLALFDLLTRPTAGSQLQPHPPLYWSSLVGRHMEVIDVATEYPGMEGFERVLIQAKPRRAD
jgi:2-polyprenyl-3-methyl-5-hydroxy-6-metoxy-1,4-benzoquinol methylase